MSTGRVLPTSVPRRGFRLATQTSPRSGIGVLFERGKLGVHPHALFAHLPRRPRHSLRAGPGFGFVVHPLDGAADIFGAWDAERAGAAVARLEELFGELQRDSVHSEYPYLMFNGDIPPEYGIGEALPARISEQP